MNLKIEIDLENDAFQEDSFRNEIVRILDVIKKKVPDRAEETEFKILDLNGNSVGKVIIE